MDPDQPQNRGIPPTVRFLIIALAIGIFVAGIFIIGALYSCGAGGGKLIGLKCMNIEVTGACYVGDKLVKEPVYVEILGNGSLGEKILVQDENGSFQETGTDFDPEMMN